MSTASRRTGREIVSISKSVDAWGDCYQLDIPILGKSTLAVVLAIDAAGAHQANAAATET